MIDQAITIADEILNPIYKDLESEYFYLLQDIKARLNLDTSLNQHAKNIKTIMSNVNLLKSNYSKEQLNRYLLQVLPYMSDLNSRLRYFGT